MRRLILAVLLIVVLSSLIVGCGCEEQANKKALEEVGEELEQEAREVLPMLYRLRGMETTQGSDPVAISSLESQIAETIPWIVTEYDEDGKGSFDTEDAIEFLEGFLEEVSSTPKKK